MNRAEFMDSYIRARPEGLAFEGEEKMRENADKAWRALEAVAAWMDQPMVPNAALVWPFYKAPEVLRTWDICSQDDADYIALLPPDTYHHWTDEGGAFGCCSVEHIELPNGWTMAVGYHS